MSQRKLAELSGVSNAMIASIERGRGSRGSGPVRPSPETLRLLAIGLGKDLVDGHVNEAIRAQNYDALMRAAGYIEDRPAEPEPERPVDDLTDEEVTDELERRLGGDREVAVSLLAAVNNWRNLGARSRRLILETVRYASGEDDEPPTPRRAGR